MILNKDTLMLIKVCALALLLYFGLKLIISIINNIFLFSFEDFGSTFDLNNNDYVKFIFNIRTDDGLDDCNIKGMYSNGYIKSMNIEGDGEKCKTLQENN